jgi:hypothetical protein
MLKNPVATMLAALVILGTSSCNGQPSDKTVVPKKENKPDIRYKVDKKYDSKGNIIRYDSSYSYSYRSRGGGLSDSIFNSFAPLSAPFPFGNPGMHRQFFNDSVFSFSPWSNSHFSMFPDHDRIFEQFEKEIERMRTLQQRQKNEPIPEERQRKEKQGYEL